MTYTTISELSVNELKMLIRETVKETIADLMADPDEGLELRDDVEAFLKTSIESFRSGEVATLSAKQVAERLDIEW